jgi:hypothetical protein
MAHERKWLRGLQFGKRKPYPFEVGKNFSNGAEDFVLTEGTVQCFGIRCECSVGREHQHIAGPTSAGISARIMIPRMILPAESIAALIREAGSERAQRAALINGFMIAIGIEERTAPKIVRSYVQDNEDSSGHWYFDSSGTSKKVFDPHRTLYTFRPHNPNGRRRAKPDPKTDGRGIKPRLQDA